MTTFLRILILCCFPVACFSQLCTGSLGDPVVNITFGSGPNGGGALGGNTTNYSFTSSGCPNDGSYTIVSSNVGCFNGNWHAITEDHTPNDANGFYMLVNSSYAPGDFYVSTVSNLCGGTTYEFAAWILNVLKPQASGIKPNVTFSIETTTGAILQSFSTGDIPETGSPFWKQYGFFFQTPANTTSVVIRMRNNAPGGNGNDLALDDITFRPCGATIDVGVAGYGNQKSITECYTAPKSFTFNSTLGIGFVNPAYQWQTSADGISWTDIPSATSNSYTVSLSAANTYYYRLAIAESTNISQSACRTNSQTIQIKLASAPMLSLADNVDACAGDTLKLTVTGSASQTWSGPNGFSSTQASVTIPNLQTANSGEYYLTASSPESCSATDSSLIVVHTLPIVNAGNDTVACSGKIFQLKGISSATITWYQNNVSLGTGNTVNTVVNKDAQYVAVAKDQYGCASADDVFVKSIQSPNADAGIDKEMMQGDSVVLNGVATGDSINYTWSPFLYMQNNTVLTPMVSPPQDMNYTLNVTSFVGCGTSSDNVFVKVYSKITVPNIFSPNGDGVNDTWVIDGIRTYPENTVAVYDRFGVKVFESRGYEIPWKGNSMNDKPLASGVYYYVIDTKKSIGKLTGWVMIVR